MRTGDECCIAEHSDALGGTNKGVVVENTSNLKVAVEDCVVEARGRKSHVSTKTAESEKAKLDSEIADRRQQLRKLEADLRADPISAASSVVRKVLRSLGVSGSLRHLPLKLGDACGTVRDLLLPVGTIGAVAGRTAYFLHALRAFLLPLLRLVLRTLRGFLAAIGLKPCCTAFRVVSWAGRDEQCPHLYRYGHC